MRVLVVNAGSSSLKLRLLDAADRVVDAKDIGVGRRGGFDPSEVAATIGGMTQVDAVGHRVVHGGREFVQPVLLDAGVRGRLTELGDLAPLHQPKSLAGVDSVDAVLPDVPAVACFDTAFHSTLPAAAATYALPEEWQERYGLRRYGFHGLSHACATRRIADLLGTDPGRLVVCHLGAGASLAAVRDGRSVDTTMGFTPLEGLVMATRSGSVDPGLVLWLHQHAGIPVDDVADALEHRSGLSALAGTADMRAVLSAAYRGDARAAAALDVYVHRLRAGVAGMVASLRGLDTLVFTGGVGEHASRVRELCADGLGYLGVELDADRNVRADADTDISAQDAAVRTYVVTAREDVEIARGVRAVLGGAS
ncbi:MAG: acetate/propionate family kinase [Streptosporangiales bacterium]|nr:acetate/propionate family kinase [Streptosporangiales bacterium]MBO0892070.1 acetate/propionate family kinase [Acidothermales bacterium]